MILVHHLENSRSQRVLWLLEELGLDYEIKRYERDKKTSLAPKALLQVHPLGKSPILEDDGVVFAETGAIIEHIVDIRGRGRLAPPPGTPERERYRYWLFAAEGSYMPPLVLELFVTRIERARMPFFARPVARRIARGVREGYLDHTMRALLDYLDTELGRRPWLAGDAFTAADVIMSFPVEAALSRVAYAQSLTNVNAFAGRIHARPAYGRALERGGPYAYA